VCYNTHSEYLTDSNREIKRRENQMKTRSTQNYTPLKTDKYEFTMLEAALESGVAHKKAVFELFTRKLPETRKYGVVAGTARAIEAISKFTFNEETLDYLSDFLKPSTLDYLKDFRFTGNVVGYREGDLFFPQSPIISIETTFGEGVLLETILLSIFNYDSAVAGAASHITAIAGGKQVSELGSRRTSEDSAVYAARAAYIAGFSGTSNLEAGIRWPEIPIYGTSAHAFTLAHPTELEAFTAQVKALGAGTTLLVDTYDIPEGIANAVEAAGTKLGAIRIDSGDPFVEVPRARKQLDELGAVNTKIVLSGDMNRETITNIVAADLAVDSFGVGTDVVTGGGYPSCSFVYKLVAIQMNDDKHLTPVAKKASGKASYGGRKTAYREYDENWKVVAEHILTDDAQVNTSNFTALQEPYIVNGNIVKISTVTEARALHAENMDSIPTNDVQVKMNE
jgi:nicotinate phosphoribosyltransferase